MCRNNEWSAFRLFSLDFVLTVIYAFILSVIHIHCYFNSFFGLTCVFHSFYIHFTRMILHVEYTYIKYGTISHIFFFPNLKENALKKNNNTMKWHGNRLVYLINFYFYMKKDEKQILMTLVIQMLLKLKGIPYTQICCNFMLFLVKFICTYIWKVIIIIFKSY